MRGDCVPFHPNGWRPASQMHRLKPCPRSPEACIGEDGDDEEQSNLPSHDATLPWVEKGNDAMPDKQSR
jgi:hypothetical protein